MDIVNSFCLQTLLLLNLSLNAKWSCVRCSYQHGDKFLHKLCWWKGTLYDKWFLVRTTNPHFFTDDSNIFSNAVLGKMINRVGIKSKNQVYFLNHGAIEFLITMLFERTLTACSKSYVTQIVVISDSSYSNKCLS